MNSAVMQKETNAPSRSARDNELWLSPAVDIYETNEGYTIQAEMPGLNKAGLEVLVENNELVIVGRRSLAQPPGEVLHREIHAAHFRRAFELNPAIDTTKITAKMEQGLLILSLPKAEKTKPRRITVEG